MHRCGQQAGMREVTSSRNVIRLLQSCANACGQSSKALQALSMLSCSFVILILLGTTLQASCAFPHASYIYPQRNTYSGG